jgi:hypothetical protein
MRVTQRLLSILGRRPFSAFGLVTFLVAALLATVNITSRHALKMYVEDQLQRIPWDLAVYQRGSAGNQVDRLRARVADVPGVTRAETLVFLRARFPEGDDVVAEVAGKPLTTPWLCLLAASDMSILPPELGFALGRKLPQAAAPPPTTVASGGNGNGNTNGTTDQAGQGAGHEHPPGTPPHDDAPAPRAATPPPPADEHGDGEDHEHGATAVDPQSAPELGGPMSRGAGAVLALVGPERAMGPAFLALQGARDFIFKVSVANQPKQLFHTPLKSVVRLDRDELNRWLMDQTGSVSYIPYVGVILLMPYHADIITKFDRVASGLVPPELLGQGDVDYGHIQLAEYEPEVVYLGRYDRAKLISGWDIAGSLRRVAALNHQVHHAVQETAMDMARGGGPELMLARHEEGEEEAGGGGEPGAGTNSAFVVDSTTEVLLGRMDRIARLIGLVTLLVSLPLLWMGWVLAANLSGLLMLNERRTLGLMRLRGIPGHLLGRTLLMAIVGGGFVGGLLGLIAGSAIPLMIYEGGGLPVEVLADRQQILLLLAFFVITLILALLVSRRLVRYATTISPLEASGRVAVSEATSASLTFGPLAALALLLGTYVLVAGWILDVRLSDRIQNQWVVMGDRLLDFLGLPLFLYGIATLLASKRALIQRVTTPLIRPLGGSLGVFAVRHLSVKPHRTVAFLLIVALMASVSLYPTITSRSFADKAERGARVQLGTEWQLLFNAPDLVDVSQLRGSMSDQIKAIQPEVDRLTGQLRQVAGVSEVTYMLEAVLPNFYLPGYGLKGVPLYVLGSPDGYLKSVYSEPEVGITGTFTNVMAPIRNGDVAVSPPVADFWRLSTDTPVLLGLDAERRAVGSKSSGIVAFLPGIPPRTVTDRQGYVQARVDYLNHLFNSNAYLVTGADNPKLANLQLLIPRVIVLVKAAPATEPAAFQEQLVRSLPFPPLEVHHIDAEIAKVGSDMYISLALANMRIYLFGGLILALIAILSIASANYVEDRRTLALLRIRGASPTHMWRFIVALLLSPALLGLILGGATALLAGFGLANYVWELREIRTVVQLLPTHLVVSSLTASVTVVLMVLLLGVASGFSWWVFRRTAHQNIQEA